MRLAHLSILLALFQAPLVAQSPRTGPDAVLEEQAWEAWAAASDVAPGSPQDTFPMVLARLAGLSFQARADRLTPDLDSALALAVMSGGKLRNSPWGWFAYSRQLQRSKGSCLPYSQAASAQWFSYCRRVADSYRQALKRDSNFAPVLGDLDRAIPWPELWLEPDQEVTMLRGALQSGRALPPAVHRRLERRYLNVWVDSDTTITTAMFRASGADTAFTRGEFLLQLSRVVARSGAGSEAQRLHALAATDTGPGEHQEWIRADLANVGSPEELAQWDSLPAAERREWLDEFWASRDFEAGLEPGSRYAEHARRLQVAYRQYRTFYDDMRLLGRTFGSQSLRCPLEEADSSAAAMLVLGCNLPDSIQRARIFDDRGLAYIRHGDPAQKVMYPGMQYFEHESWVYFRADGPMVLHFSGGTPPVGFVGKAAMPVSRGDWMTACKLDAVYCGLEAARSTGGVSAHRMSTLVERGQQQIERMRATDGAVQWFREPLRFNAGVYGLGRRPGMATLAVDVPLTSLRKLAGDNRNRTVLRWQVRIRGADGSWPVSSDSLLTVNLPEGGDDRDRYITLIRQFNLPPGTHAVRLVLSDLAGTTGAMFARDGMTMVGNTGPGLSDLVLIPDGDQGAVRSMEGESVHLSPTFTAGTATYLRVGYLLVGMAGRDVPVSVEISPADPDDAEATGLAVEFTDHPDGDRSFFTKRIGVEQLQGGHYDLSVSVQLPDGSVVRRTQRMAVRR